jgi:hypothetical protein
VEQPVWVTETGGIARLASGGRVVMPLDEARAAASVRKALAIVRDHPDRIARAYFYQWVAPAGEDFDSGLLRPGGEARPSLEVVRDALGTRPVAPLLPAGPTDPADVAATGGAAAPQPPAPRIRAWPRAGTRRPRAVRRGYRLRVRCRPRVPACAGRVTLSAQLRAGGARTVLGSRAFRVGQGGSAVVTVRVPRKRKLAGRRLIATVVASNPPRLSERSWEGTR